MRALFEENCGQVAAVVVELMAANMGVVPPKPGFLEFLRCITKEQGALLLFDEVITGLRLGLGGASAYTGVHADLYTFGKIVGGGMPLAAYGGMGYHVLRRASWSRLSGGHIIGQSRGGGGGHRHTENFDGRPGHL